MINFVYDYSKEDLLNYSLIVIQELNKREYKYKMDNFNSYFGNMSWIDNINSNPFKNKMNDRYLKQCLYNLEEKAMCNGMKKDEWNAIYNKYKDKFDLWKCEE